VSTLEKRGLFVFNVTYTHTHTPPTHTCIESQFTPENRVFHFLLEQLSCRFLGTLPAEQGATRFPNAPAALIFPNFTCFEPFFLIFANFNFSSKIVCAVFRMFFGAKTGPNNPRTTRVLDQPTGRCVDLISI